MGMNNTQLIGIRELHEETTKVCKTTYTARQIAEMPHNLSRDGMVATLKDGRTFIWDARFQHWASWK